jgi:fucose permease
MSFSLVRLNSWSKGYLIVAVIQIVLSAFVFLSLPVWKKNIADENQPQNVEKPLKFNEILKIKGAVPCFLTFFAYCSLELTASLWASSYLVENRGFDVETASAFASMFFIGITVGRGINGFLAMRFGDRFLIRLGICIITPGILMILLPLPDVFAIAGFVAVGLGCAPIYPCIIHMTPEVFGKDKSQAIIGIQIAFAYIGFCVMPPLFGFIAEKLTIALLPVYLLLLLGFMTVMHEIMVAKTKRVEEKR